MKKLTKFALLWIFATAFTLTTYAQPGCGNTNLGTITPTIGDEAAAYAAGDTYYWDFAAVAGETYSFSSCGAGEDTYIRIYDGAYTQVAGNDDNGPYCSGTAASIDWACTTAGTYYVSLAHYSCNTLSNAGNLTYWSTVPIAVTCGNTYSGVLTPTTTSQTAAYAAGDSYYWSFDATDLDTYTFSSCGAGEDTYIRIYDAGGTLVANNDDNGPHCTGTSASIDWTCTATATYYVSLAHYSCNNLSNAGNFEYYYTAYVPPAGVNAPWIETFSTTSTPANWSNIGAESWLFSTGAAYGAAAAGDHTSGGGTNYAWIDGSGGVGVNALVTPVVDISALTIPQFSFWYFSNNTNNPGDNNTLDCEISIDGGAWANIFTYTGDDANWLNYSLDLSSYTITTGVQFQFIVSGTAGTTFYNDILVDDVSIDELPTTPIVTVSPASPFDFNFVQLGNTASQTFTVTNTGGGVATITGGSLTGNAAFTITASQLGNLPPDNVYFTVDFNPTVLGVVTTTLTITDNLGTTDVIISGEGVAVIPNDDCVNAIVVGPTYPETVTGTTKGAEIDCPGVLNWNAVWYEVTLPYASNDLSASYCGTATPPMYTGGIVYIPDCSSCSSYVIADYYAFDPCVAPDDATLQMSWDAVPGPGTIMFPAYAADANGLGVDFTLTFDVTEVVALTNDDCADATVINEVTDLAFSTTTATFDGTGTCLTSPNIWFEYVPTITGLANFDLCGSSYDTKLGLWDACGGTNIACNDDACGLQSEITDISVVAGVSIWVEVGGYSSSTGNGDLSIYVQAPSNDDCANAAAIGEVTDLPFSTILASFDGTGTCLTSPNIWYEYTPSMTGTASFDLCGSAYDTKLGLWDACGGTNIACNDDACGVQSEITGIPVTIGVPIWVEVGGYSSNVGNGDLTISVIPPTPGESCANPIFAVQGVNNAPQQPVWYEYTTTTTGYLEVSSLGSGVDTRLYVYSDCSGTLVDDDDDFWGYPPGESLVYIPVNPGETYYILWGDNYSTASFTFTVVESSYATTWTGLVDSDWWNLGNWSAGIPGVLSDVTIPTGAPNYPTMSWYGAIYSLYVESDATGDGSLLDNGYLYNYLDDVSGDGTTVERYTTTDVWHTWSSSVTGATADIFHFGSSTGYEVYLLEHSEATNGYTYIVPTTTPLPAYQGWFIWGDGATATPPVTEWTYLMNGGFNTGIFGTAGNLEYTASGWNFLGNPYTSALDWESAFNASGANVDATVYVYDAPNYQWATWNTTTGGTNGGSQYVAMGQGFFVHANASPATFSVDNTDRVHNGVAYMKSDMNDIVKLQISNGEITDETSILFRMDATEGFDSQYDAYKLFSMEENAPQIYSYATTEVAVNTLPEVQSVPLYVHGTGVLTIAISENEYFANLYLEDLYNGEVTDLNQGAYTFDYVEGLDQRFVLHFAPLSIDEDLSEMATIYAFRNEVRVTLSSSVNAESITVYDMMGKEVTTVAAVAGLNIITMDTPGNYVIKVIGENSVITEKVFVK